MILDKATVGTDRRLIGHVMKKVATGWNTLSIEEKTDLQIAADVVNHERQKLTALDPRIMYTKYAACLDQAIGVLKTEFGLETICFVSPDTTSGFNPNFYCHGSGKTIGFILSTYY